MPEPTIVLILSLLYGVPIGAAIWALVTLQKLRAGQQAVQLKLDTIEQLLQRS